MIPAKQAQIVWNTDKSTLRVTELLVVDMREVRGETRGWHPSDAMSFSDGACWCDWLEPGKPHRTPLGVYVHVSNFYGFASREVAFKALKQFAGIEGQAWAVAAVGDAA